jgi:hypothetical protein
MKTFEIVPLQKDAEPVCGILRLLQFQIVKTGASDPQPMKSF